MKRWVYTVLSFQVVAFIALWVGKPFDNVAFALVACSMGLMARVAFDIRRDRWQLCHALSVATASPTRAAGNCVLACESHRSR